MNNNRKINILQLVNGFAIGGAELKLLELVKHLQQQYSDKYNQVVCSVGQGGPLQESFEKLGLKVFVFPKKHKFDIGLIFKVARLLKKEKIDIIQTTLFYADVIGAFAAKLSKTPITISWETVSHSENVFHAQTRRSLSYRLAMKFAYKIVTVSKETKDSIIKRRKINKSKIKTINYGVDTNKFIKKNGQFKKKEIGIEDGLIVLGVIGRLEQVKGHIYLLYALAEIKKQFTKIKCIFIGDGSYRSELEKKVEELNLDNNVLFLGFRDDILEILNILDIFILPSISEGLPNAMLEAMACSLPLVATSVGGVPEVIEDGKNGILVPAKNIKKLKNALQILLTNPKLRKELGSNARNRVEEEFSVERQVEEFSKLYDLSFKLLGSKNGDNKYN